MRNKSVAVDYGMIVIGTVLMSMGIKNIFDPANMVTGGVTGAAGGIAAAVTFGCLFALIAKPQSKS